MDNVLIVTIKGREVLKNDRNNNFYNTYNFIFSFIECRYILLIYIIKSTKRI